MCLCVRVRVHVCEKGQRVDCEQGQRVDCEHVIWKGEGLCLQVSTIRRKGGENVQYFCLFISCMVYSQHTQKSSKCHF